MTGQGAQVSWRLSFAPQDLASHFWKLTHETTSHSKAKDTTTEDGTSLKDPVTGEQLMPGRVRA